MGLNIRLTDDAAVLSNFGALLNDPRHFDAGREVAALLDEGIRAFVFDLSSLRDAGATALGLLVTLTRPIRRAGGEVALARVGKGTLAYLEEMQMEDYWDVFDHVDAALASFGPGGAPEA